MGLWPVLFVIWALFIVYAVKRITRIGKIRSAEDKNMSVLQEDCDPEKYIGLCEKALEIKGLDDSTKYYILLNMAVAYYDLGHVGRAWTILSKAPENLMNTNFSYRIAVHYNRFMFSLAQDDPEETMEEYRKFKEDYALLKWVAPAPKRGMLQLELTGSDGKKRVLHIHKKQLGYYEHINRRSVAVIKTFLGDGEGAAEFFEECYQHGSSRNARVYSRFYQAVACKKAGRYEECRECLTYVIQRGNRLAIVKKAEEMKASLPVKREQKNCIDTESFPSKAETEKCRISRETDLNE